MLLAVIICSKSEILNFSLIGEWRREFLYAMCYLISRQLNSYSLVDTFRVPYAFGAVVLGTNKL